MVQRYHYTNNTDAKEAAEELKKSVGRTKPRMIVYFASEELDGKKLAKHMKEAFPESTTFGCSSAGNFYSGSYQDSGVVALALPKSVIKDVSVEVLKNHDDDRAVNRAFKRFEKYYGVSAKEMPMDKYIGMVINDGLGGVEEKRMDQIGNETNVQFIGGSSADNMAFKNTEIYADGKMYNRATLLALIKPARSFEILKSQSMKVLDKEMTVDKTKNNGRLVNRMNKKSAVKAYAEALGISEKDVPNYVISNPIGIVIDKQPYVRSILRLHGKSIEFASAVLEGMTVNLLQTGNIVSDTRRDVNKMMKNIGDASGLIMFNCAYRKIELAQQNKTNTFAKIFKDIPMIGCNSFGEQYLGHVNQTSTMVVFK